MRYTDLCKFPPSVYWWADKFYITLVVDYDFDIAHYSDLSISSQKTIIAIVQNTPVAWLSPTNELKLDSKLYQIILSCSQIDCCKLIDLSYFYRLTIQTRITTNHIRWGKQWLSKLRCIEYLYRQIAAHGNLKIKLATKMFGLNTFGVFI